MHKDKTMVSLKAGLSFAWLDKELNNKLIEAVGPKGRNKFIREAAKEQFNLELVTKQDLLKLDIIIKKHYYQDRADWLREICRNKIKELNK